MKIKIILFNFLKKSMNIIKNIKKKNFQQINNDNNRKFIFNPLLNL